MLYYFYLSEKPLKSKIFFFETGIIRVISAIMAENAVFLATVLG